MNKLAHFASRVRRVALCLALTTSLAAHAQIRTDGSLGGGARLLAGPNYVIPQSLGRLVGANLFHSFAAFNINSGESAQFTTSTSGIGNVISRVTGGNPSQIFGALSLVAAGGAPNFYLINPAGVTFGAGASINVPAAFHVSTAAYLKFPDGNFYADPARTSTFSSVDPVAFGFLGASRAPVLIKDAILANAKGGVSITAGDVVVDHAGLLGGNGNIQVAAVGAEAVEVGLGAAPPMATGTLQVINGGAIYTEASGTAKGGDIALAAGDVRVSDGSIVETATATGQSAGSIRGDFGALVIDGRNATNGTGFISLASLDDVGTGGHLALTVRGGLDIFGGGMIVADAYGLGKAGNLTVNTGQLTLDGSGNALGARITNRTYDGGAGVLQITTSGSVSLTNNSQVSSDSFGLGRAGDIGMNVGGNLDVLSGSIVASNAYAKGNAGSIGIVAENVRVDSTGSLPGRQTQISSQAFEDSEGNAGTVDITARGAVNLLYGGKILTSTNAAGQAGNVRLGAAKLLIDGRGYDGSTGIFSTSDFLGTGNAGLLDISVAGDAALLRSGQISTSTWGEGNAGRIAFKSGALTIDGQGSQAGLTQISSEATFSSLGHGGDIGIEVAGALRIADIGLITSSTSSVGNAGSVTVKAGQLSIDGGSIGLAGIESSSAFGATGNAGRVVVAVAGDATLNQHGYIRSDTSASGKGGEVSVTTGGRLSLDQGGTISSSAAGTGDAGDIGIQVGGELNVGAGGRIRSNTTDRGNAGSISIGADRVTLSKGASESLAWIESDSLGEGQAGAIQISARTSVELRDGGFVSSDTYAGGQAGSVFVTAPSIRVGSENPSLGAAISSDTYGLGNAGKVVVAGDNIVLSGGETAFPSGILSASRWNDTSLLGNGGTVDVSATGSLLVTNQATISSSAYSDGRAGTVSVKVGGDLTVRNGGTIASATLGDGDAGAVSIRAGSLVVDGSTDRSVISSRATTGSSGNAGNVEVTVAGDLKLLGGGRIDSSTYGGGVAGTVRVDAADVWVDGFANGAASGINAIAATGSSGQIGQVTVNASRGLVVSNGGELSLRNDATVADPSRLTSTTLFVSAPDIRLEGGRITTAASGNVAAGDVRIDFANRLVLNGGSVTTSANDGNGGAISIQGGRLLELNDAQITTSVLGLRGNGGDIRVATQALAMNTGFIQANTAAANASGGNVGIDVATLLPSASTLYVGGRVPYRFSPGVYGFNVIQAAAPTGVSGRVTVSAPTLDLSGSLASLTTRTLDPGGLGRNPCRTPDGSSLAWSGRGYYPVPGGSVLDDELLGRVERVRQLLLENGGANRPHTWTCGKL